MTTGSDFKVGEPKEVTVKIITCNNLVVLGKIKMSVSSNSYRSRLSDMLNQDNNFIAITHAEVYKNKKLLTKTSFLSINKDSIILLTESQK